jgi:hypothetical protein
MTCQWKLCPDSISLWYRSLQNHLRLFGVCASFLSTDSRQDSLAFYRIISQPGSCNLNPYVVRLPVWWKSTISSKFWPCISVRLISIPPIAQAVFVVANASGQTGQTYARSALWKRHWTAVDVHDLLPLSCSMTFTNISLYGKGEWVEGICNVIFSFLPRTYVFTAGHSLLPAEMLTRSAATRCAFPWSNVPQNCSELEALNQGF